MNKLKIFEASIQNENAYEIKGRNSIHNQLTNAMWIIDDVYWLLYSNKPLANFLKKRYTRATKKERLRPDFVCVSNENKLVIVEIKRPSHEISQDVTQLQNYLAIVDEYDNRYTTKEGFIIGKNISNHLRKVVKTITNVDFKSYLRLVEDCRRRYQEYLDAFQEQ